MGFIVKLIVNGICQYEVKTASSKQNICQILGAFPPGRSRALNFFFRDKPITVENRYFLANSDSKITILG